MIDKFDFVGYFFIVWDIVCFCQQENILVQGCGLVVNSVVCYVLLIIVVDLVKMELFFECFFFEECGEWLDIDFDLLLGDQCEKVIQYVYRCYGCYGLVMIVNVIIYCDCMVVCEVVKVFGYFKQQVDCLVKWFGSWYYDIKCGDDYQFD